jgi:hypothetical protein
MVDRTRFLIEDGLGKAVCSNRSVDCLPDIELFSGAAVIAQRCLVGDVVANGNQSVPQIITHGRLLLVPQFEF